MCNRNFMFSQFFLCLKTKIIENELLPSFFIDIKMILFSYITVYFEKKKSISNLSDILWYCILFYEMSMFLKVTRKTNLKVWRVKSGDVQDVFISIFR